jgi:hypothetical protein
MNIGSVLGDRDSDAPTNRWFRGDREIARTDPASIRHPSGVIQHPSSIHPASIRRPSALASTLTAWSRNLNI